MAKDGTNRGGARPRSGSKKEPLVDKVTKGKEAKTIEFPISSIDGDDIGPVADLPGADMPQPSAYLSAKQKLNGKPLGADVIFKETMKWLKDRGCYQLVNPRLVESYSEAFARYIQCSEAISTYGLVAKHPTTKMPIASPFVQMSLSYQKQANILWYEIFQVVKENSMTAFEGNPQEDAMEKLLSFKRKPSEMVNNA